MKKFILFLALIPGVPTTYAALQNTSMQPKETTPINSTSDIIGGMDKQIARHYEEKGRKYDKFFSKYLEEEGYEEEDIKDELENIEDCGLLGFHGKFPYTEIATSNEKKNQEIFELLQSAYAAAQPKQIEILIKNHYNGKKKALKCNRNATVKEIKYKIENTKYFIEDEEKLDHGRMRLIFNGKLLNDDVKISDRNIKEDSLLQLVMRSRKNYDDFGFMQRIIIKRIDPEVTYQIEFREGKTVNYIKNEIMKKSGIQVNKQNLIYAGKRLDLHCNRVMSKYDIPPGALLHLVVKSDK